MATSSANTAVISEEKVQKLPSLSTRSNVAALLLLIPFLIMAAIQVYVSRNVQDSRELLVKKDIPIAIHSLAMLDELGDMHANMLEFVLGEQEEHAAYYDNLDEYDAFFSLIPEDKAILPSFKRMNRLIHDTSKIAEKKIFSFDPKSPDIAKRQANEITDLYAWPLYELLGETLIDDPALSPEQVLEARIQLVQSQYQLKLIMAALQRHAYNDLEAKYQFYEELLQLEQGVEKYLSRQEEKLTDATVIEVMRLLAGIRRHGTKTMEGYDVRKFMLAATAIDEIEHYNYKISEDLLTDVTEYARNNIEESVRNLKMVVNEANVTNQLTALAGCIFLGLYLFHVRSSYLRPIASIASLINNMRAGDTDINFKNSSNSREVYEIVSSLEAFDTQLTELELLRNSQRLREQESHRADQEKAYAELAERERMQRETADELRKVNNDLEQFVHIASHDLREPLKKMSSFAQMLEIQLGDEIDEKSKELLGIINSNAFSMGSLIDDLRSLTRIYDSSLIVEQCNLESIVHQVLSEYAENLKESNASINVSKLPTVPGYLNLMRQVFDNLVRNALAHGDEKLLLVTINHESNSNGHTIYFTNSSSQTVHSPDKLLQPFVKGRDTGGTGMGLAICKKIIEIHNGSISIDASVAYRFTIRLELNNHFEKPTEQGDLASESN